MKHTTYFSGISSCICSAMTLLASPVIAQNVTNITAKPAVLIEFATKTGKYYQLEKKVAGSDKWQPAGTPIEGTGQPYKKFFTVNIGDKTRFRQRQLAKQWVMVWNDDFNGNQLDTSKWAREENGYGGGNNERQFYSANNKYCHVKNGNLNISVYRDPHTTVDGKTQPYTSARIRTKHRAEWKYGRFEIRAKMPKGQGIWPAVWMLPSHSKYGGWASSGEIDIIESRGSKVSETTGALHFGGAWPRNTYLAHNYQFPDKNAAEAFHTYVIEWKADEIKWFINGKLCQTRKKEEWFSEVAKENPSAPFDQPFHLIVNVAVDGRFFEKTAQRADLIPPDKFPQTLEIDYIRVYQWAK